MYAFSGMAPSATTTWALLWRHPNAISGTCRHTAVLQQVIHRHSVTGLIMVLQVAAFRRRVQFTAAVAAVPEGAVLLEVGPHSLLRGPLRQGAWANLGFAKCWLHRQTLP